MTLSAIIFGVVGLILSGGFVRDLFHQIGEATIHSQLGHIQVFANGYYDSGSRSPDKFLIPESARRAQLIARLPEVKEVMARISFSGLLNNGHTDWPIFGEGVEPDAETRLGTYVVIRAGRALTDRDSNGILLGSGAAQALDVKPGDSVVLLMNTAEGALNTIDLEVVGIFESFSKEYDARAVRIHIDAARKLLAVHEANSLVVLLHETEDTDTVAQLLRDKLGPLGLDVRVWYLLADFYEKTVKLYDAQFKVLQLIVLLMVLLTVFNTVNMGTFERIGEFGTMMALGNRRRDVFRLVITENFLLGVLGAGLGCMIGVIAALGISHAGIPMPPPPNSNVGYVAQIRVVPSVVALAALVGLGATMLASLLPARRVSRMPPVEALRFNI
ncbi:MAG: ABC transporter permease [Rhodocyclaceae bacterium]|nr:ABC transporter permease [Rhodocyclaceae bacterium]MBX3667653.1 ABC transporter permease [Rhodocyclaceae bacterium]